MNSLIRCTGVAYRTANAIPVGHRVTYGGISNGGRWFRIFRSQIFCLKNGMGDVSETGVLSELFGITIIRKPENSIVIIDYCCIETKN